MRQSRLWSQRGSSSSGDLLQSCVPPPLASASVPIETRRETVRVSVRPRASLSVIVCSHASLEGTALTRSIDFSNVFVVASRRFYSFLSPRRSDSFSILSYERYETSVRAAHYAKGAYRLLSWANPDRTCKQVLCMYSMLSALPTAMRISFGQSAEALGNCRKKFPLQRTRLFLLRDFVAYKYKLMENAYKSGSRVVMTDLRKL